MPNTLYDLFQKAYGVLVTRTDDRISAVTAGAAAAAVPGGEYTGAPLLRIDRIAFGLDDRPIEWRVEPVPPDGRALPRPQQVTRLAH